MWCTHHFEVKFEMSFLKIDFLNNNTQQSDEYKYRNTPFIENEGEIFFSPIESVEKLSDSFKRVYKIVLKSSRLNFLPGDTIGILPCNNKEQVEKLITRLNLINKVDQVCELGINPNTTKKNAKIPKHLPPVSTLRNIFLKHVDIEAPPKKLFLKTLSNFAQSDDKTKIENILLKSQDYFKFIETCGGLLGLLETFPTLQPPIETLLENLPPLQPRPYSISSSPLVGLEITFFVVDPENGKKGVCTGWLENLIEKKEGLVPFYFRKSSTFRFCDSDLILIATGTGISPFRGFWQHINLKKEKTRVWLIYGCRNDEDFLFKNEIQGLDFVTLDVAFSRKSDSDRCHVQDILKKKSEDFIKFINENGKIFICGDYKTVIKDVKLCICEIFNDANMVETLAKKGKLAVDTWA